MIVDVGLPPPKCCGEVVKVIWMVVGGKWLWMREGLRCGMDDGMWEGEVVVDGR